MSTDADRFREEAVADEWEEWAAEQIARLWEVHADDVPWNDASSDEVSQPPVQSPSRARRG